MSDTTLIHRWQLGKTPMPCCAAHGMPTSVVVEMLIAGKPTTVPVCAECVTASGDDARLYTKSLSLIVGGIWTREDH